MRLRLLRVYSPVIVFAIWGVVTLAIGRSTALSVVGLLTGAFSFYLHISEIRRCRGH